MSIVTKNYQHYVDINTEVDINRMEHYNLNIVYYINCYFNQNNNMYYDWIINQTNLIKEWEATIYIIAVLPPSEEHQFRKTIETHFKLYSKLTLVIECHYNNNFEYEGILKIWELGQIHNNSNDLLLYFHAKGITHSNSYENNKNDAYNIILKDLNKIKEIFDIFPKIDKIGYASSHLGWVWYNFWYARGSYIFSLEKPIKTERRHYYEDWLARKVNIHDRQCSDERNITYYPNTLHTCYQFYTDFNNIKNIGSFYDPNNNCFKNP